MAKDKKLSNQKIEEQYNLIKRYHKKFLKERGVKLPRLRIGGNFTKSALVLVYLSQGYPDTKERSKQEITNFVRKFYPNVNDVQQPRHLGAQKGWWIVAGGRDNIVFDLKRGYYQLYSLEEPYPGFKKERRGVRLENWEEIKKHYDYRCATCGSLEGKPHYQWAATKTRLQKAHKNPNKPLTPDNVIPQCQKCNRADRNRWVYDDKGRVIKLAKASYVKSFGEDIQRKIYKILYKKYKGEDPYEE